MTHPLSQIITAKLNGTDPHARTTITNAEAIEIRHELDRLHGIADVVDIKHLPRFGVVDQQRFACAMTCMTFCVADSSVFKLGDLLRPEKSSEVMLVVAIVNTHNMISVNRGYAATDKVEIAHGMKLEIIGNASTGCDCEMAVPS